jgi:hypothetical protein
MKNSHILLLEFAEALEQNIGEKEDKSPRP